MPRIKKAAPQEGVVKKKRGRPPLSAGARVVVKKGRGRPKGAGVGVTAAGKKPSRTRLEAAKQRAEKQRAIFKEKQKALKARVRELVAQIASITKAAKKVARKARTTEKGMMRGLAAREEALKKFEAKWSRRLTKKFSEKKPAPTAVIKKKGARRGKAAS
ncbi:MAG: hypothetical protein IDH49_12740 [Gammaproteobacteria bacterium]|nr:hypothetical protein [Gammaproteobacteria bacterium]